MICQSRVVNLSDPRVIHEKRRDLMGVRGLALNPQIQCLQLFQYKPGVERTERRAGMPQDVGKLFLNDFTVTEKRVSEAPPLTIDMLGRRIGNNVGTERQRFLHDWRCQRIVKDKFPVGGMG